MEIRSGQQTGGYPKIDKREFGLAMEKLIIVGTRTLVSLAQAGSAGLDVLLSEGIRPVILQASVGWVKPTSLFRKTNTYQRGLHPPYLKLLDVIAPDRKSTGQVIANFRQVVKEGDLRIHPIVAGLVDDDMRGKMMGGAEAPAAGVSE